MGIVAADEVLPLIIRPTQSPRNPNQETAHRFRSALCARSYSRSPAEDLLVTATGCGASCQAGYEEPVGWGWRTVAAAGIIAPFGYRSIRAAINGLENGLQLAKHLLKGEETVALYRAVSTDELDDVLRYKIGRN